MNPQIRELDEPATKNEANFVETALKLGGASEEEAKKTGALDRADEQVEDLFAQEIPDSRQPGPPRGVGQGIPDRALFRPEPARLSRGR